MCAADSKFKNTYNIRIENNQCVRCGQVKYTNLRKCKGCRVLESEWRRYTRDRRRNQERWYKQSIYDKRIVMHSKLSDIKMNRPIMEQCYITPERIRTLRRLQNNACLYCSTTLQIINRREPDGLTCERIKNAEPHNQDNVILCCHRCNVRRIGNKINQGKTNLEIFYDIWCKYNS